MIDRNTLVLQAKVVVVKVGSSLLVRGSRLQESRLAELAENISLYRESGKRVILVSSGAVACGMSVLSHRRRKRDLPYKQAMAAVGQVLLMERYSEAFSRYTIPVAQVLLAPEDIHLRSKYLNTRNTFTALLELGVLPIVNENDTVAVEEIRFGDNDRLSALVASLLDADLLVILSDVEGLYTGDPKRDPSAVLVREVAAIDQDVEKMGGGAGSALSTGGMRSKIIASHIATRSGTGVIVASGKDFSVLRRILQGDEVGTFFHPQKQAIKSRKRWIGFGMMCRGSIIVDHGAELALQSHKSLLPAGVKACEGSFDVGDCVDIKTEEGRSLGRGLVNFASDELARIRGMHTSALKDVLSENGFSPVVIHVDNLVLFSEQV